MGYVTRVLDPVDRRKVQLRLTDAGVRICVGELGARANPWSRCSTTYRRPTAEPRCTALPYIGKAARRVAAVTY
jgi:hypothetical protein